MHYYKRNLGDYAKKAGRLTMLQHGSYTLLIDACYDREQFPTMEEALDWTWASSQEEIDAVQFVLRKFFTLEGGRYIQKRIQEEIEEYRALSAKNSKIAADRETKRKGKVTERAPDVHESSRGDDEAPPNQEPLTINQEPVNTECYALLSAASLPTDPEELETVEMPPGFPDCPHGELLALYRKHLPHLTQPRSWAGKRATALRCRWRDAGRKSAYSEGYETRDDGLRWWDSFLGYIAKDTKLSAGFESQGRSWRPDIEWIVKAENFQKIIDGKYDK